MLFIPHPDLGLQTLDLSRKPTLVALNVFILISYPQGMQAALAATDATQRTLYVSMNYNNVHFGQSDWNYFYNPYAFIHIFVSRYLTPETWEWHDYLSLNGWQTMSGYDGNSKDFSYLNQFDDITIDSPIKSRIIYNTSLNVISIDLEPDKYCDVHGNKIYGSVSLQPFGSKILIFSDYEIPDPSLEGHLNKEGKIQ